MVKILNKYCVKEALAYFFIALGSFTAVLLTIRMLKFAALIVDKGVEFWQVGLVFLAIIPTFLEIALPLSALLGVILAYARLSGDSEIVVLRASGISIYQLLKPTALFAAFVLALAFSVSFYLKPKGYSLLSSTLFEIAKTRTTSGLEEGVFNRLNVITIYAEKIDDLSGQLQRVVLDDRRDPLTRRVIFAKQGIIASDQQQLITFRLEDGEIHERTNEKYSRTNFSSNVLQLNSTELLEGSNQGNSRPTAELSILQLRANISYFKELESISQNRDAITIEELPQSRPDWVAAEKLTLKDIRRRLSRTETELGSRFSLPFASFILALLALPLGIQPSRAQQTWGVGISVITGMAVFVIYYGLYSLGIVLAQSNILSSTVALWLPNFVALILALFFLRKLGSEQWQSISDLPIKKLISRLGRSLSKRQPLGENP